MYTTISSTLTGGESSSWIFSASGDYAGMAQDYNHLGFISEVPRGVQGMSTRLPGQRDGDSQRFQVHPFSKCKHL